jgi:pimeloyl-ACP methyl ester carboxylesterase
MEEVRELPYRERFVRSMDGLALYFRDYGPAPSPVAPLLCLPGLTRNSKDFHDLALRYASERRVICPDYRGRGRSDHDPHWRNYSVRTSMGDVLQILAATNIHEVVVIGTSMGGIIAMILAAVQPRALAGVVLNDVGPDINLAGLKQIVEWMAAARFIKENAGQIGVRSDEGWLKLARNTYAEGPDGKLHFDYDLALMRPVADLVAEGKTSPVDLWPFFRALRRIPVLLIRGERSTILKRETVEAMAEAKPDLISVEVAGAGHVPMLDEPEALDAIDDFLTQH